MLRPRRGAGAALLGLSAAESRCCGGGFSRLEHRSPYTRTNTRTHAHTHTRTLAHMHTRTHAHTHSHTHLHTRTLAPCAAASGDGGGRLQARPGWGGSAWLCPPEGEPDAGRAAAREETEDCQVGAAEELEVQTRRVRCPVSGVRGPGPWGSRRVPPGLPASGPGPGRGQAPALPPPLPPRSAHRPNGP